MDHSLPGFSVRGIFQARVLEWLPFPSPGDIPDPEIEPKSPALQADALPSEPPGKPFWRKKDSYLRGRSLEMCLKKMRFMCMCRNYCVKRKKKTEKFPFLVATFFFPQLQWQNNKQAAKKCVNILFCLVSWNSLNQFSSVQLSLSVMSDSLRPHESKQTLNRVNY